ncbi:GmrSD restriction endonuclease domain-containing protein [Candidatus Poriferisocius sp.]|uniref:GmrSD restriction endonuclease domain-containing protein n=1 Tax=Candidatus Poriferisocius sp. TaxID=3101276 RepID=UPI003B0123C9
MRRILKLQPVALLVAAVGLVAVLLTPVASAQTQNDVEVRDQLIANQEDLLNTYRCQFGVDTGVVPGGCPTPDRIEPGPAPANPTQNDIDVRDGLIQSQEALLNIYRCQFDVDTQLVPGGCAADGVEGGQQPDDAPSIDPPSESAVIGVLDGLAVEAEYEGSGYVRAEFEHDRGYLCDNAGTDPYTGISFSPSTCDVDHIVAAQEAFESGAWAWDTARRMAFGNDAENLVATRDCVNRSKGARDMAEWSGRIGSGVCQGTETTVEGRCFMAQEMVQVKAAYSLSVDQDEKDALTTALADCSGRRFPSTLTGSITGTIEANSDCHPAYSPCLPNLPGDAINCGDLTAAQKPVTVLVPGVDPYRLDRDGDGRGCTS